MQFADRIKKLQERMIEKRVDITAIGPTSNMRYFLGYSPFADERLCTLLIYQNEAVIVAPAMSVEEITGHTSMNIAPWKDSVGPGEALKKANKVQGDKCLLAVDSAMRADGLLQLMNEFAPDQVITADELVFPLRLIKTREEIDLLARAAVQADKAMQAAVEHCKPGVTEKDVAWAAETAFKQYGADEVCFTIVASGPNGAVPHHHSQARKLRKGDTIVIDIGATTGGYKSDITRVVHLGKPEPEVTRVYDAVNEANQKAMKSVKPGVKAEEIDYMARSFLEDAGYGEAFLHRTGHGIGLDIHEPPWIMEGNDMVLQPGMTFSIEPGVYLPGKLGVRVEDIVVVTDTGVQNLSGFSHDLVIKE